MPIKIVELDIARDVSPIWGIEGYSAVRILVRFHAQPVGWIQIENVRPPCITTAQIQNAISDQLQQELAWKMLRHNIDLPPDDPSSLVPISVAVCTRDRADQLETCLKAILEIDYPEFEIIVVDNASRGRATAQLAERLAVRYIREDRPGLDWARNRAIREARFGIIAFTDDDARPDAQWLRAISAAFRDASVAVVTGLVCPAELETWPQMLFELGYGGMGHGVRRRTVDRQRLTSSKQLLWASGFGIGANMAFRRKVFASIGNFDVALDVGTPTRGGGDVEMFHRVVSRGYTLVYEPQALVWHYHRRDAASLRRLMFDNGHSFGAYLRTLLENGSVSRGDLFKFVVRDWMGWWLLRRLWRPGMLPRHLVAYEIVGAVSSPWGYARSRQQAINSVLQSHSEGSEVAVTQDF